MPFARPTLTELRSQVASDIASAVTGSDPLLRFSNLKITGDAQAGLSHLHFGYLDWIAKQAVPWTSTGEFLAAWAALKNVYQKDATQSIGAVTFPGSIGTTLSSGTLLVRGDGAQYTTTSSATVDGTGNVTVSATANTPGAAGNCASGVQMTLGTAIPGIQSTGVVSTSFLGGADQETEDSFYARAMAAYQASPQGGAKSDYPGWAKSLSAVTRAWCMPNGFGAGTVVVYVMLDNANASFQGFPQGANGTSPYDVMPNGNPRGVLATGDQLAIANAIYATQPVTALVYVCAPLRNSLAFTISGLTNASLATRAAVSSAITEVLNTYGDPRGATVDLSDIESSIAAVPGTRGFVITSVVGNQGGSQVVYPGNIISPVGYLPILGSVAFT